MARILDATYYGRRVEALMILTNLETFETLTQRCGHSPEEAADVLIAMTQGFVR